MPSKSLWVDHIKTRFPTLHEEITSDAVIVGGGIAGLATAYFLARRGISVVVLEAISIGCGTTAHTSAHITSQHDMTYERWKKTFGFDTGTLIAKVNEDAISDIAEIISKENIVCDFSFQPSYLYTNDPKQVNALKKECITSQKMGIHCQMDPHAKGLPLPFQTALRFDHQAMFHPTAYIQGLADAIIHYGGKIFENSRVEHIHPNKVSTQSGHVRAPHIVICTHNPVVNFPGMYFARMYQHRSYVMAFENAPQVEGLWVSIDQQGHTFRMHKNTLLVCGEDHKCGLQTKINHYEKLLKFTKNVFPNAKPICQWSAQDGITLDHLPYIGRYSAKNKGLYVATGFGKWGMTQSHIAAKILCDLVMDKENIYTPIFSPQRPTIASALANALVQSTAVFGHWVGGQARCGAPTCSHLKCKLIFNQDEQSWDCPCHGSRFTKDGHVLDTPAIHGLKNKNTGE